MSDLLSLFRSKVPWERCTYEVYNVICNNIHNMLGTGVQRYELYEVKWFTLGILEDIYKYKYQIIE